MKLEYISYAMTLDYKKKTRTCSVTRVRNEVPFVRERELFSFLTLIDIKAAKIVRFLQFKL